MRKLEIIGPDPKFFKMVDQIMEQNATILKINAEIVKMLMTPPAYGNVEYHNVEDDK